MSIRAIIGGALSVGLTATVAISSCRSPSPSPAPHMPASGAAPTTHPATIDAAATAPPVATTASAPVDPVAAAVSAARACTAPSSQLRNEPDGGLVFVNAWRRQDAGNIDRLQGIVSTITEQSTVFRCCFDAWTASHPATEGKLMLKMELAPDGAVQSASIDDATSTVDDDIARACVVDVAKGLTYPASPNKSATLVEYPFVVGGS